MDLSGLQTTIEGVAANPHLTNAAAAAFGEALSIVAIFLTQRREGNNEGVPRNPVANMGYIGIAAILTATNIITSAVVPVPPFAAFVAGTVVGVPIGYGARDIG